MIAKLFKTSYATKHEKHFRDDFFQNALDIGTETVDSTDFSFNRDKENILVNEANL